MAFRLACCRLRTEAGFKFSYQTMVLSVVQKATRAFVSVLLAVAAKLCLTLSVSRDSVDSALHTAYRRLLKAVKPREPGHQQLRRKLETAKEKWEKAREKKGKVPLLVAPLLLFAVAVQVEELSTPN